ncbi:hypothetical protein [Iodobacter fluviatilis]|uniref:Uncharacterized protein n=1 Tax=Iodobacter fluviatilis TaxID=537 RepID=A0A377Q6D0_9NEIS|nr:hypothetical protein [Iodobacter fluviatilis]TCU89464.1 hypothetical protein EV682_102376 [Iodobacter fluviatilis]STQ90834.1 Uncharacterised protein [Iodobacter fluviatilis]
MVTNSIAKIIETTATRLSMQAGAQLGTKTSPVEAIIANYGNFYTSLAYAGFFFPTIRLVKGIPFATFPTSETEISIDCVHVDLLHHTTAAGNEPEIINALGLCLTQIWSQNLIASSILGKFVYESSEGCAVIYQP